MPSPANMTDQEILDGLLKGGSEEARCLKYLYWEYYPLIRSYVQRSNGTEEEATDVFQDGVITFYEQVKQNKYRGDSSIKTYLFAICKNLWFNQLRKKKTARSYTEHERNQDAGHDSPETLFLEREKHEHILKLLDKLGEACRKLLQLKLYQRKSMEEIRVLMGFKNDQIARNKHYKCKKERKRLALEDPVLKRLIPDIL